MNELEKRTIGILEGIDETANAALGPEKGIPAAGNCHFTISQRLGQMILYGTPQEVALAKSADALLTYIEVHVFGIQTESHCLDAVRNFPISLPNSG